MLFRSVYGFADKLPPEGASARSDTGKYEYNRYPEGKALTVYGKEFRLKAVLTKSKLPRLADHLLILPDSALTEEAWGEVLAGATLFVNTKGYLPPEFNNKYSETGWDSDFSVKDTEFDRLNTESSVMIVSALFVGVAFMFFSMALLSLKVMAEADLDKKRYKILNMLGVSEAHQRKILFRQIMSFMTVPMIIPLLMTVPAVIFSVIMIGFAYGAVPFGVYAIGGLVPAVYAVVYFAYFLATYYLSVKNNITPLEKPTVKLLAG